MNKTLKNIFTWILTIILFISTIVLLILLPIKHAISTTNIKETITNIDIEELVNSDAIKNNLDEYLDPLFKEAESFGIDKEIIIKVINTEEVKSIVGDIAGNVVHYAITGENTKIITANDLENIVNNVIVDISENIFEIKTEEKEKIINVIVDNFPKYEELLPDAKMLENNLDDNTRVLINLARFTVSNTLILYLSIAIVVSLLGIVYFKKENYKWLKWNALTIFVAAIIPSIIYLILSVGVNLLLKADYNFVYNIINPAINFGVIINISIFILMIITLIVFHILKVKKIIKG